MRINELIGDIESKVKQLKEQHEALNLEQFFSIIENYVKSCYDRWNKYQSEIFKLEKKILKAKNINELRDLKSERFWKEDQADNEKMKIYILREILVEWGWELDRKHNTRYRDLKGDEE